MADAKPIPEGYTTVTPSITVNDAPKAIDFYKKALGATERGRFDGPDGKIMHAEIQVGNARIMLMDEVMGSRSPKSYGGSPVSFYLYVENCDTAFKKAIDAGGKQTAPVSDMFWGDRMAAIDDPDGYRWNFATNVGEMDESKIPASMKAK